MKQLTCEMCGSTDLVKQDGFFVCQTCGCKYSVEEAKKMMIEGTVEVQGSVNVQNFAQLESLLKLAHSSYNSKNYAQAEAFCNQVIAMDSKNYEAWKLKGEAINYQIGTNNQRILEVYNCIMTSYRVLDESQKKKKRAEILSSLKSCLEGEVTFWLNQFEKNRPSKSTLKRVQEAYIDAYNKLTAAFDEFGYEAAKAGYLINFDNFFVNKVTVSCESSWKTTVGYNYYRDYFGDGIDPFGRENSKYVITNTDLYRPTDTIWETFVNESDILIQLSQFAEEQFNDETDPKTMEVIYSNISYLEECIISSGSWSIQRGQSSAFDGYYSVGWHEHFSLTDEAKASRQKTADQYNVKKADLPRVIEMRQKAKVEKERMERVSKYWKAHPEQKSQLENDLKNMQEKKQYYVDEITQLQKQKEKVPALAQLIRVQKNIEKLVEEKKSIGLFKGKEKKAVQEKIDVLEVEKNRLKQEVASQQQEIEEKISPIRTQLDSTIERLKKIEEELTMDRSEE